MLSSLKRDITYLIVRVLRTKHVKYPQHTLDARGIMIIYVCHFILLESFQYNSANSFKTSLKSQTDSFLSNKVTSFVLYFLIIS